MPEGYLPTAWELWELERDARRERRQAGIQTAAARRAAEEPSLQLRTKVG
jgi:hypothetical protein